MFAANIENVGCRAPRTRAPGRRVDARNSDRAARRKRRILVVEDEIFIAWHLEAVLQDLDYAVCGMVPDGESAVAQAEELDADVILMDINLNGAIDGVEAARRIRQSGDAPIIFITAYSDPATLGRIEKTIPGAAVLAKPVSPVRLRAAIEQALQERNA